MSARKTLASVADANKRDRCLRCDGKGEKFSDRWQACYACNSTGFVLPPRYPAAPAPVRR